MKAARRRAGSGEQERRGDGETRRWGDGKDVLVRMRAFPPDRGGVSGAFAVHLPLHSRKMQIVADQRLAIQARPARAVATVSFAVLLRTYS